MMKMRYNVNTGLYEYRDRLTGEGVFGKYAGEKLFQKKAPTPKPHGDLIMKKLTKDQEKNADFEARLSRLIAGAGKK